MRTEHRHKHYEEKGFSEPDEHKSKLNLHSETASGNKLVGRASPQAEAVIFKTVRQWSLPTRLRFRNPNQRSTRQQIEERNQVRVGEMDAAVRRGLPDGFLVRRAVNINVARARIHAAAALSLIHISAPTEKPPATGWPTSPAPPAIPDRSVRAFACLLYTSARSAHST